MLRPYFCAVNHPGIAISRLELGRHETLYFRSRKPDGNGPKNDCGRDRGILRQSTHTIDTRCFIDELYGNVVISANDNEQGFTNLTNTQQNRN